MIGSHTSSSNNSSVYLAFRHQLDGLSFRAFQSCVLLWLSAKGFRHVRSLGRRHRRGRRATGGADFVASLPQADLQVAVQLRHWRSPVQRRAVDEFWGYLLRASIPVGILIANTQISESARRAAAAYPGRPIHLISQSRLAGSMAALGLGVCGGALNKRFFECLERISVASCVPIEPSVSRNRTLVDHPECVDVDHVKPMPPDTGPWWTWLLLLVALVVLVVGALR